MVLKLLYCNTKQYSFNNCLLNGIIRENWFSKHGPKKQVFNKMHIISLLILDFFVLKIYL